jgi:hypothetical protein
MIVVLMVLVGIVTAVFVMTRSRSRSSGGESSPSSSKKKPKADVPADDKDDETDDDDPVKTAQKLKQLAEPGTSLAATPKLNFRGAPIVVEIDDDGVEDVLSFAVDYSSGAGKPVYVALSGVTWKEIWRAELGGEYDGEAALAGPTVAVVDQDAKLRFIELASGKALATTSLSDKPRRACRGPDGQALFELYDRTLVLADGKTATASTIGARPAWCPKPECGQHKGGYAKCLFAGIIDDTGSGVEVEGFDKTGVLVDGDLGVMFGHRTPGTETPRVVGFDVGTKKVLGQIDVPDADDKLKAELHPASDGCFDLRDGIAYVLYEVRANAEQTARLAAFDPKAGTKKWDVVLAKAPTAFGQITVGRTRLYAEVWTHLFVVATKDGSIVADVGH